jgi:hypothetical protein
VLTSLQRCAWRRHVMASWCLPLPERSANIVTKRYLHQEVTNKTALSLLSTALSFSSTLLPCRLRYAALPLNWPMHSSTFHAHSASTSANWSLIPSFCVRQWSIAPARVQLDRPNLDSAALSQRILCPPGNHTCDRRTLQQQRHLNHTTKNFCIILEP